jgi:DNA repair protein RecN (Recombination protein N)
MLTHLHIRDYALIDRLEIDLEGGFTVLTGETGAGKSILIEALGLALGDRADSGVIREGAGRAEVIATIRLDGNEDARRWLAEEQLDDGDECLLRRTVSTDGRSKAWINGSPVPLTALRGLGELLIDIHGQHEHHSLLGRDHQAALLDGFANHPALLERVREHCLEWKRLEQAAAELEAIAGAGGDQFELLRYQARELDSLNLADDELLGLDEEHRRLAGAGQLIESCRAGINLLHDNDDAVAGRLAHLLSVLRPHADIDRGLAAAIDLLDGAAIQIDEAAGELRNCLERLDLDPDRLDQIERRLAAVHDIARKHRVRAETLPALRRELHERLDALAGADARLVELRRAGAQADEDWRVAAQALSCSRAKAAQRLSREVTREMRKLGMPEARFTIEFEKRDTARPSPAGLERAAFLVGTNPQQTPRPLSKVASGGELSRMGLAIQMITARQAGVPTVIFDEVDVGIGGRVAEIVGQGLRALGGHRQVLCITHLPQVAALGHHHLQITKLSGAKGARIAIRDLEREQRSEEIARMLGGIEISAKTREHADELINRSEELAS